MRSIGCCPTEDELEEIIDVKIDLNWSSGICLEYSRKLTKTAQGQWTSLNLSTWWWREKMRKRLRRISSRSSGSSTRSASWISNLSFHTRFDFVIRMGTDLCLLQKSSLSYPSKSEMRDAASHGNFESGKFFMIFLFPFHPHFKSMNSNKTKDASQMIYIQMLINEYTLRYFLRWKITKSHTKKTWLCHDSNINSSVQVNNNTFHYFSKQ